MCKITRFELDEALECIKSHAPHAHAVIEKYVDQLERDKTELRGILTTTTDELTFQLSLRFDVSIAMAERNPYIFAARAILERSK